MQQVEIEAIQFKIKELRLEHDDLDQVISRLADVPSVDDLQLRRLKKRKLFLKDHICHLEQQLVPDIRA